MSDVLIAGGGVIGLASALELAGAGASVVVVERGETGGGATWAAGGMLAPLAEARQPGPFLELALASVNRYRAFVDRVEGASGVDVELRAGGKLQIALSDAEMAGLREQFEWQTPQGHEVQLLDAAEARELEPALSPEVRGGLLIPSEERVDPRRLADGLRRACGAAGVVFRTGTAVAAVERGLGGSGVAGVRLENGDVAATDRVVIAAGAWSGGIAGLPQVLPVEPVRGQMIALGGVTPPPEHVILSSRCYLIPRVDGRVYLGSTMERVGFDVTVTAAGVNGLVSAAIDAMPQLASATVEATWAGLRPGTPDGLPVIGLDPALTGLIYATGHLRNGILLAPITAEIVASLVAGTSPPVPIGAFRPSRFVESEAAEAAAAR